MGFLLGALGKQMAAKRVRSLQARMMSVQRRAAAVTREIEQVTKSLESQKKMAMTTLSSLSSMAKMGASAAQQLQYSAMQASIFKDFKDKYGDNKDFFNKNGSINMAALDKEALDYYNGLNTDANKEYTQLSAANSYAMQISEQMISQQKAFIEEQFSAMEDLQLQPLKDEEDALETEKMSLESQIQLAQNDQKACEEMEKNGVKNLVPSYTGGNG